jgi:2-hydroxy-6-oxonona-2,4-dienedioate hydrolase
MSGRKETIDEILGDLESLRGGVPSEDLYALEENIELFRSLRSFAGYLKWLLFRMPKIDSSRLLELSDFKIPKWEAILQKELLNIEKWKFPDIIGPLKKEVFRSIKELSDNDAKPVLVASVGSGGMEVERQLILRLKKEPVARPIIFVGIDGSQSSINGAFRNLAETDVRMVQTERLESANAGDLIREMNGERIAVIVHKGDALSLSKYFSEKSVDVLFYSKFIHHLSSGSRAGFVSSAVRVARRVVEWDDYRGFYMLVLAVIMNWKHPVLLNGAIFSCLRDPSKRTLRRERTENWRTRIFPLTGYLKTYDGPGTLREAEEKLVRSLGVAARLERQESNGRTIAYLTAGTGPPLLLIHGINIGWGQWHPNIAALAERFTVYAVDLPGAGNSGTLDYESVDFEKDYVETLEQFIIKKRLGDVRIIGHSFGGWIASEIARRGRVGVGKIALISPIGMTAYVPWRFRPITMKPVAALLSLVLKPNRKNLRKISAMLMAKDGLSEDFTEYYYRSVSEKGRSAHPFIFINSLCEPMRIKEELDLSGKLPDVRCPTLVVFGGSDPLLLADKNVPTVGLLPNSKLVVLPDTGHVPNMERADEFNSLMMDFFDQK